MQHLAFSPAGDMLVAGTQPLHVAGKDQWRGALRVWDVKTWKVLHTIVQSQWVRSLSFSPDGKLLAVGCGSQLTNLQVPRWGGFDPDVPKELKLYEVPSFKELAARKYKQPVKQVAFSPDKKHLVVGLAGELFEAGTIQILEIPSLCQRTG